MTYLQPSKKLGNKFQNPVSSQLSTGAHMLTILWKFYTNKEETVPKQKLGPFNTDPAIYLSPPASGLRVTWLGHSSLLIELDGHKILTDPVWSERASFSSLVGPKRFFPAPLGLNELPPLDAVIISHDHYDHLDKAVIRRLAHSDVPFFCSVGVSKYLRQWGVDETRITEMDWTDTVTMGHSIQLTALPARHFSGRSLFNRFETLWSSFALRTDRHNVYFGADSGWFDGFSEIGSVYGPFDLTLLEIGAYNEHWADIHMGPENAVKAHLALRGKQMMPIHWGTFNLALHAWKEPVERLVHNATDNGVNLLLPKPGTPVEVTGTAHYSGWWE